MSRQKGFSLIELLIVVGIIGVIATIAIPNLLTSQRNAREASAVGTLRTITTAEANYMTSNQQYATLAELVSGKLVDAELVSSNRNGYTYELTLPSTVSYNVTATPVVNATQMRYFYADDSGVIREQFGAAATAASPALSR
jgi:prepilin-type N-terminal cleavage/methylation domain-containing protein